MRRKPIVRFDLEPILLLAFWVQKRCKIALSFHCCIYSEYTSHPPIFVHALEAEKLQIGPKVDCDWSILGSRFSLVESSAFPGCLANVAACLNSCFMPTPIFTLISAKPQIHIILFIIMSTSSSNHIIIMIRTKVQIKFPSLLMFSQSIQCVQLVPKLSLQNMSWFPINSKASPVVAMYFHFHFPETKSSFS